MRPWPCDPGGAVHKALPTSVYGGFCQEAHPGPEFDGAGLALPLPPTGDPDGGPPASSGDLPG